MEKKEWCERYEWNMKYRNRYIPGILSVLILTLLIDVNGPQV